jgi:hypothetical protein
MAKLLKTGKPTLFAAVPVLGADFRNMIQGSWSKVSDRSQCANLGISKLYWRQEIRASIRRRG